MSTVLLDSPIVKELQVPWEFLEPSPIDLSWLEELKKLQAKLSVGEVKLSFGESLVASPPPLPKVATASPPLPKVLAPVTHAFAYCSQCGKPHEFPGYPPVVQQREITLENADIPRYLAEHKDDEIIGVAGDTEDCLLARLLNRKYPGLKFHVTTYAAFCVTPGVYVQKPLSGQMFNVIRVLDSFNTVPFSHARVSKREFLARWQEKGYPPFEPPAAQEVESTLVATATA